MRRADCLIAKPAFEYQCILLSTLTTLAVTPHTKFPSFNKSDISFILNRHSLL